MITAGEPGGGDPLIRARIEDAFGCKVRESMGIGDISLSVWAEDDDGNGMHFMAREFVHVELIDPASGEPIPWDHKAEGELVYTALRRDAMPLLRFRSRDHVVVNMDPNPSGRTGPRIRCIGRTDDMLQVRPKEHGVLQTPPLPVVVELGEGFSGSVDDLRGRLKDEIRARLLVTTDIELVPYGTVPRETYKSKLIDYSDAAAVKAGVS